MRTKYLALATLILALSCTEEDEISCRVTKITTGGVTTDEFTYDASGKLLRWLHSANDKIEDSSYKYNQGGTVEKIDYVGSYTSPSGYFHYNGHSQIEYANGKISVIIRVRFNELETFEGDFITWETLVTDSYTWNGESFEITRTLGTNPNPSKISKYEYGNPYSVTITDTFYSGNEPNVVDRQEVSNYEQLETAVSASYLISLTRPGLTGYEDFSTEDGYQSYIGLSRPGLPGLLETNHRKFVIVGFFEENISYEYNSSNTTIGSSHSVGSYVFDTTIGYDQCK